MPWQRIVGRGLAPLTIGLVVAGGYVMARSAAVGWESVAITAAAVVLMLGTRLNPLWIPPAEYWVGSDFCNGIQHELFSVDR
jgi:chromate transport protein ChrA